MSEAMTLLAEVDHKLGRILANQKLFEEQLQSFGLAIAALQTRCAKCGYRSQMPTLSGEEDG